VKKGTTTITTTTDPVSSSQTLITSTSPSVPALPILRKAMTSSDYIPPSIPSSRPRGQSMPPTSDAHDPGRRGGCAIL